MTDGNTKHVSKENIDRDRTKHGGSGFWPLMDRRLAITLVLGFLIIGALIVTVTFKLQVRNAEGQAAIQASAVMDQMLATRGIYTEAVIAELHEAEVGVAFSSAVSDVDSPAIPLPASLVHLISARVNEQGLYSIDLISPWPINPDKAPRTEWEKQAIAALIDEDGSVVSTVQNIAGEPSLLYARADFATTQLCVSCHNAHPMSPRVDYVVGDMMGALVVRTPLGAAVAEARTSTAWISLAVLTALAFTVVTILRTRLDSIYRLKAEVEENRRLLMSKDQLVAAVSHELRTPLTGIVGFTELLAEDDIKPEERREAEEFIRTQAGDLSNIVEDLLTAARVDMGNLVVMHIRLDLLAQAEQTIGHMRSSSFDGVAITGDAVWTEADPPRIRQIIRNLLTNASRYGGTQIDLWTGVVDCRAVLSVKDDGEGVPPAAIDSVFDAYETAHFGGGHQPGSVGLGLNISRTLARLMGGDITYSRSDGWTEFRLALPLLPAADSPCRELRESAPIT